MRIPIIDMIDALTPGAPASASVAAQIKAAAETSGFFYVRGHGMPQELVARQFDVAAKFFELPLEEKNAISIRNSSSMRGYESIGSQTLDEAANADFKESFQCGLDYPAAHPYVAKRYAAYGQNQWPGNLPELETASQAYFADVKRLSTRLMQLLALSLDVPEGYFEALNIHPADTLRMLNYPPQPAQADGRTFGAGAHTDWGTITILAQDAIGGLEVKMPDGDWVPATPIPGTFVVNLGDLVPRWTNGRYRSNPHRVRNMNSHGRNRQSVVFFTGLDYEARIEPLAGFLETPENGAFAPFTVGEHMVEMYRKTYGAA